MWGWFQSHSSCKDGDLGDGLSHGVYHTSHEYYILYIYIYIYIYIYNRSWVKYGKIQIPHLNDYLSPLTINHY